MNQELVYLKTIDALVNDKTVLVDALFEIMTMAHKRGQKDIYEIANEALHNLKNPTFQKIQAAI